MWTPAGEEHWHGGIAQNMMCHYAILDETSAAGGATTTITTTDLAASTDFPPGE